MCLRYLCHCEGSGHLPEAISTYAVMQLVSLAPLSANALIVIVMESLPDALPLSRRRLPGRGSCLRQCRRRLR